MFYCPASQNSLLIAEASFRGWVSSGSAAQYFSDGIRAHMDQMGTFDPSTAVSTGARDTYVANNPLNTGTELEQINTQYWISSFLNGPEAFANFRRSGFPALAPNPYPGKEITGTFIRRYSYPSSEISSNNANVQEAITRQGPDNLDTRVWWDKP